MQNWRIIVTAILGLVMVDALYAMENQSAKQSKPNIIVIISDDAGYADFSMHGCKQFATPHIDSIAKNGIRFSQGYVSASVCSPSRAGLMTGRYQQRFGHELNIPPAYSETNGLPVDETTLADMLRAAGYRTIALGKWHLGYAPHFHPLSRGFDDYFGFLQGARNYRPIKGTRLNRLLRDRKPIAEDFTYMTDELGNQAAAYIEKHKKRPFFMYLSFNAVHTPMHAKLADLALFPKLKKKRRTLAAMTKALDDAVGTVLAELKKHSLTENTMIIFINDNGGARTNASVNLPLRGWKGTPFEGGLRVAFVMQWPGQLPKGRVYNHPVISLDIFPTAKAAAGVKKTPKKKLDGVNLLPFLTGNGAARPHETLFWRKGPNMAVRDGDWKLLKYKDELMLFDLAKDMRETTNLVSKEPKRVRAMLDKYKEWESQLVKPRWRSKRRKKKKKAKIFETSISKCEIQPERPPVKEILSAQARAWNAGKIERFMAYYWKSDRLTFSSGGKTTRGWAQTLANYKRRYPTREKMGRLRFDGLETTSLGTDAALVLGRWYLKRNADDDLEGNFSLVFRRINTRWVIVHDHTSVKSR